MTSYKTVLILHTSVKEGDNHNWVMHQYHLEMEKEGEFVVYKIFSEKRINKNAKGITLKANEVVPNESEKTIFSESTVLDLTPEEATSKVKVF